MARARSYMRAPENICARIYFWCAYIWRVNLIYVYIYNIYIWRAPDNIWRAPDHICVHQKIEAHAYIFWCAYIWRAPSNIWRVPDNIWRAPDHICAHQKNMRTHMLSGARIYGARHLIYGARQIIYGARQIIYARTRK